MFFDVEHVPIDNERKRGTCDFSIIPTFAGDITERKWHEWKLVTRLL